MELRLDRLLDDLRRDPASILAAIDADPLLLKRTSGDLVLANPTKNLYTPQAQHQLYAKGIVYRRDPFRLVSLPLVKIYNAGEKDVGAAELSALAAEPGVRLCFLRKLDGSLVQAFRDGGKVWFTTRGMIEGARWKFDGQGEDRTPEFDFIGTARRLAQAHCPALFDDPDLLEGRTLVFELIHPAARVVTDYGDRADLTLLACFDRARCAYLAHEPLRALADAHGLGVVDAFAPAGEALADQFSSLLASLSGTDQEGSVVCFERGGEVVYRVKIKSPEYLRLMRMMAFCTYEQTVAYVDANPGVRSWADLEAVLQRQGSEMVPEEVLGCYREHYDRFVAYLADLARLREWAEATRRAIDERLGGPEGKTPGDYRRAFAAEAKALRHASLVFAALDGKLDADRLRKTVRDDKEAREAVEALGP